MEVVRSGGDHQPGNHFYPFPGWSRSSVCLSCWIQGPNLLWDRYLVHTHGGRKTPDISLCEMPDDWSMINPTGQASKGDNRIHSAWGLFWVAAYHSG